MIAIGICGASGSGKSTLARNLTARIDRPCVCLRQDSYYFDHPGLPIEELEALNYDDPSMLDHEALYQDLISLQKGDPIPRRDYDFVHHRRCDPGGTIPPADIVICEGIHLFYNEQVREAFDLRVYMQVDPDLCLLRRIKRDMRDRGRDFEGISRQYRETVKPMFEAYIRKYAEFADVIVPIGGKNPRTLDLLATFLLRSPSCGCPSRLDA